VDLTPYGETHFIRVSLFNVRVIIVIIRVPVVELLRQVVTGRILVLKYLLSGTGGHLWPYPVVPDIKCHCFLMSGLQWCLLGTESPRPQLLGA
jgi:hypothetical protein